MKEAIIAMDAMLTFLVLYKAWMNIRKVYKPYKLNRKGLPSQKYSTIPITYPSKNTVGKAKDNFTYFGCLWLRIGLAIPN